MRIVIVDSYADMSVTAARLVRNAIVERSRLVLGLATGGTQVGMYRELVRMHKEEGLDFSGVITFNLDEYLGLGPGDPTSYYTYMHENFFNHVNVKPENIHIPDGKTLDPEATCRAYEEAIAAAGGIDLQILGIGVNGHIGFNEPGTPFDSVTRPVNLTRSTILANKRFFLSEDMVPRRALSMGIKTIMNARRIILLASGRGKARAIAGTVEGPVTCELPSSVLQLHPDVTLIIDREASSLLRGRYRVQGTEDSPGLAAEV